MCLVPYMLSCGGYDWHMASVFFKLTVNPNHLAALLNRSNKICASASITAGNDVALISVDKFCYLGSFLSNTVSADSDITSRLAKAGSAFGKLQRRLWDVHDVSLKTNIAVY